MLMNNEEYKDAFNHIVLIVNQARASAVQKRPPKWCVCTGLSAMRLPRVPNGATNSSTRFRKTSDPPSPESRVFCPQPQVHGKVCARG